MEQPGIELSVMDVYDIASEIGKEFEKIIDSHGPDTVKNLMPKVIFALENLENFSLRNEKENLTIQDLKDRIAKLEMEKIEKAEDQKKFERELEQIEEHWKSETQDLVSVLSKVQEENRKLRGAVADQKSIPVPETTIASEVDVVVLQRLKALVDNQREQIKTKEKELTSKLSELETLTMQVDKLTTMGKELKRKHKIVQNQVRILIEERADFLGQLQDQQKEISLLRQSLGVAEKENEDLTKNCSESSNFDGRHAAVYDLDDPNRPRFTTSELKDILQERNDLKAKISDLEDELDLYRPKPSSTVEDDEAPVQGPLPYEPDDAPWKKSDSFVRKLYALPLFVNYLKKTTSPFLEEVQGGVFQRCPNWVYQVMQLTVLGYKDYLVDVLGDWLNSGSDVALDGFACIDGEGNPQWIFDIFD